jgi:hypothetical protein
VLVNEWIGTRLLRELGLPVPDCALIELAPSEQPLTLDHTTCHFGSQYPGNAFTTTVYDHLPYRMLQRHITDVTPFVGALVFDVWAGNTDMRQAVFYREPYGSNRSLKFLLIDNSHIFGGPTWDLTTEPALSALVLSHYATATHVYSTDLLPWIKNIRRIIDAGALQATFASLPIEWQTAVTPCEVRRLINVLLHRSEQLEELVTNCIASPRRTCHKPRA